MKIEQEINFFILVAEIKNIFSMLRRFSYPFLIALVFIGCHPATRITQTKTEEYVFTPASDSAVDSVVLRKILPYREKMSGEMNIVLAGSDQALERGTPEGLLGDFVADACLFQFNKLYYPPDGKTADFLFLNNGGLRKGLPKGNLTKGDIYELMPFENELVVLTLEGSSVKKIFNFIASKDGAPVSGVRFQIRDHEAVNIFVGETPFDSTRVYKVVTSDYLANGGDQYSFLSEAKNRESVGLKVRDAIIQHLYIKGKTEERINLSLDGRISYVK